METFLFFYLVLIFFLFFFIYQTVFSCFFHGQMLFHAKALELYTAAFQNVFSMDEEQDIEVCNFSANLALASKSTFRPTWPTSSCVAHDKKVQC